MTQTSFNKRKVRYEEIHCIKPSYFDALVDAADIKDGNRVLDCGCGYGAVTREILKRFRMRQQNEYLVVDLVDESDEQLEMARSELKNLAANPPVALNFIPGTFPSDFCWENKYDVAVAKMVLHEVRGANSDAADTSEMTSQTAKVTQPKFMQGLVKCLKPGGTLIIWDLNLTPSTRSFFCDVLRKKDTLAGFDTLVERRNFLSNEMLSTLFAQSGLVMVRQVLSIDYEFSTRRRLASEFSGDETRLEEWHKFIRQRVESLQSGEQHELRYRDDGSDIQFTVKAGIFRGEKPTSSLFVLDPFRSGKKGEVQLERKMENYGEVALQTLQDGRLIHGLSPHHGLMRASILTRAYTGKRQLCREGLDFLYNYSDKVEQLRQANAYLCYLISLYCGIADRSRPPKWRSMSDALTYVFSNTSAASWLHASRIDETNLRIEVGTYRDITGQAIVVIPAGARDFFEQVFAHFEQSKPNIDFGLLDKDMLVRLKAINSNSLNDRDDFDWLAEELAKQLQQRWHNTLGVIQPPDLQVEMLFPNETVKKMCEVRPILANLHAYLSASGTPHCYYFLPPSLFEDNQRGRLEDGVFVLSAESEFSFDQFEMIMDYVSGFWSGLGALEGQVVGRKKQEQDEQAKRSLAIAGYTHQVGHVLGEKSGLSSLSSFAKWLADNRKILESALGQGEDFEFRSAQTKYACILPNIFASAMGNPNSDELWGHAKNIKTTVEEVWSGLVLPCARAAGRIKTGDFGAKGREPELVWYRDTGVFVVPYNEIVEAVLFELFWNACRHGCFKNDPDGHALIEIGTQPASSCTVELLIRTVPKEGISVKDNCCRHVRAFVDVLRSWNQAKRAEMFNIDFSIVEGKWVSRLVMPIK